MLCFFAYYKKTILFQKMCSFFLGGGGGGGRGWQVCWIIKNVLDKHDFFHESTKTFSDILR